MNTNFQLIYLKLWFNEFLPVSMLEWNSFLLKIKYILISLNFFAGICLLVLRKYHVKNLFFSQISYKIVQLIKRTAKKIDQQCIALKDGNAGYFLKFRLSQYWRFQNRTVLEILILMWIFCRFSIERILLNFANLIFVSLILV